MEAMGLTPPPGVESGVRAEPPQAVEHSFGSLKASWQVGPLPEQPVPVPRSR